MIGIVLLSADGYYVGLNGELPKRPWFDKDLLLALCKGMNVLCSPNTEKDLPTSVVKAANIIDTNPHHKSVNLGISTFRSNPPDIMIVVQNSQFLGEGKKFDRDWLTSGYNCLSPVPHAWDSAHIWLRKPNQQLELDL